MSNNRGVLPSLVDGSRWRPGVVALAFAACLVTIAPGAPSARSASPPVPAAEASFVGQVNAMRTEQGLATLAVDGELTAIAREWAATMADGAGLSHNPNLEEQVQAAWTRLSENVGYGSDVEEIMDDFRGSTTHVGHILDAGMTRLGVGVVQDTQGDLWTTHVFMAVQSSGGTPAPAPTPRPRPSTTKAKAKAKAPATTKAPAQTPAPGPAPTEWVELHAPTTQPSLPRATNATQPLPDDVALAASTPHRTEPSGLPKTVALVLIVVGMGSVLASTAIAIRRTG